MSEKHALQNVEVSNSINLSLNQNDLIDLAISEQVEKLEAQIELKEKELEEVKSGTDVIKDKFLTQMLSKINSKQYKEFSKVAEMLGIDISKSMNARWHQDNSDRNVLGSFIRVPEINSNASDKIASFKRNGREEIFYKYNIDSVGLTANIHSPNNLSIGFYEEVTLSSADKSKLNKELEVLNKRWYQILVDLYNLNLELVNYKYGEKRIKAKFVKAALSKSKEGQDILAMLGKATNVKLLS